MKNAKYMEIHKGDIVFADLGETIGSEQSGIRPVIVIQNDVGNKFSPTVIVAPLTSKIMCSIKFFRWLWTITTFEATPPIKC